MQHFLTKKPPLPPSPLWHPHLRLRAQVELDLHALQAQYASYQGALDERDSKLSQITEKLHKVEAAHACCSAIEATRLHEIEAARKELDICRQQREHALHAAQAQQERMRGQVAHLEAEGGSLRERLRALEQEHARCARDADILASCKEKISELQQAVALANKAASERQSEANLLRWDLEEVQALHSSCGSR